jgi:histone-lysine N-methyltransferase SETMAR
MSAKDTAEEINSVLGPNTVSYELVKKWFRNFKCGQTSLEDASRSGRPVEGTTDANVSAIRELIKEDPRITLCQMAVILKMSGERVHNILRNILNVKHLCVQWVPHSLTDEQMATRLKICQNNLKMFELEGQNIINRLVTGDETIVYYYENLSSREAKLWVLEDEEPPKVPKSEVHVKKIMYAVFFRSTGIVKVVKLDKGEKVTADWYTNKCLPQVFNAIRENRPKSGIKRIILHHDNARPHKAKLTEEFLYQNAVQVMPHPPPPYSPDIAPCDFWLFRKLKKHLRGRRFSSEEEIDQAVNGFFNSITPDEWRRVYDKWQERMKRVISARGDYF